MMEENYEIPKDESGFDQAESLMGDNEKKETAALQGDRLREVENIPSRNSFDIVSTPSPYHRASNVWTGRDLMKSKNFSNVVAGHKLNPEGLYYQVSPLFFANRSLMRATAVRKLLHDRRLPYLYKNDRIFVVVSSEWMGGSKYLGDWSKYIQEPELDGLEDE